MLPVPTVFVIGAGAGADIRMPLGTELSALIAEKLNFSVAQWGIGFENGDAQLGDLLRRHAQQTGDDFRNWIIAGRKISSGIRYTRSIDSFLHLHKDDERARACAKAAITQVILEKERACDLYVRDGADRSWADEARVHASWIPDFFYLLHDGIVVSENPRDVFKNLTLINFNYDRCIEQFLYFGLQQLFRTNPNDTSELLSELRIYHPYGVVGPLPWQANGRVAFGAERDDLIELSSSIRTFDEQIEEGEQLDNIRGAMSDALRIVFLGFHFNSQNVRLLQCMGPARGGSVAVYATTTQRSDSDLIMIDKAIRSMLQRRGGSWHVFTTPKLDCKQLFREYGTTLLS